MPTDLLLIFDGQNEHFVEAYPNNWKCIEGNPISRNWRKCDAPDLKRVSGIWQCTPGKFTVDYKVWEFCHLLEGECVITPESGNPCVLKAGDAFILNPGFNGTWEITKTVRKHYVIQGQ